MRYIRVWVALVGLALVRVLVWPGDLLSDDDFAWILRLRQGFYHFVEGVYGEPYASFLGGLTVGLQPAFPLELKMAFRDTGLLHILVVSGSNIALVISCFMISAFFLRRQRRIFFFGPAILSFVFFAGLSAPTLRAGVMGLLMVLSLHVGRARSSWRALVFAGLLLVIVNPSMISSISFWLSFLATMAVLFVYSRMEESLKIASPSKNAPDTLSFLQRFLKNPICAFFPGRLFDDSCGGDFDAAGLAAFRAVFADCAGRQYGFFTSPSGASCDRRGGAFYSLCGAVFCVCGTVVFRRREVFCFFAVCGGGGRETFG
jgi:ComEC/Rec2-related protein